MADGTLGIAFPLDPSGFLRRQCPYCNRQFKAIYTEPSGERQNDNVQDLYCPYCGQSADAGQWWTPEQVKYVQDTVQAKTVAPMLADFKRQVERVNRRTAPGLISLSVSVETPPTPTPRISGDLDDMRVVHLACCNEDIKIDEDWSKPVYCIICGATVEVCS